MNDYTKFQIVLKWVFSCQTPAQLKNMLTFIQNNGSFSPDLRLMCLEGFVDYAEVCRKVAQLNLEKAQRSLMIYGVETNNPLEKPNNIL